MKFLRNDFCVAHLTLNVLPGNSRTVLMLLSASLANVSSKYQLDRNGHGEMIGQWINLLKKHTDADKEGG